MPQYTVLARTRAGAVIYPGKGLKVDFNLDDGKQVELRFWTDFLTGFDVPVPQNLCMAATGCANNLADAASSFHHAEFQGHNT
jgi:hypothetical protein